jgi:hypothetical protein
LSNNSQPNHIPPAVLHCQAVAFQSTFSSPGPLISIAAAFLDLQHDHPALLTAAATAAVAAATAAAETPAAAAAAAVAGEGEDDQGQAQAPQQEEAISLLLALAFFRVQAPDFVLPALEVRVKYRG